jgi:hypothetical protein
MDALRATNNRIHHDLCYFLSRTQVTYCPIGVKPDKLHQTADCLPNWGLTIMWFPDISENRGCIDIFAGSTGERILPVIMPAVLYLTL